MKTIAVTGTHGVGKTTLAHQICVALKEHQCGVTVVEEKARACPFPINEAATTDTEIWMALTQIRAELHAKAQLFDVAVTDRCSLDVMIYWQDFDPHSRYLKLLRQVALEWFDERYDLVVWVEPSEENDLFIVDAKRAQCAEYRRRIRDLFREQINALPERCRNKIIRVEPCDIFNRTSLHSPAVQKLLEHPVIQEMLPVAPYA